MVVAEQIIDRIAHEVGKPVEEIKALNMYQVGGRDWTCTRCTRRRWCSGSGGRPRQVAMQRFVSHSCLHRTAAAAARFHNAGPFPRPLCCIAVQQEGDLAPFGQALVGCQAQRCWDDVMASSGYAARNASVEVYNKGKEPPCTSACALQRSTTAVHRLHRAVAASRLLQRRWRLSRGATEGRCAPGQPLLPEAGLFLPIQQGQHHTTPRFRSPPPPPPAEHRFRKRGVAVTPTKFGISFTTKFLNQAGALVHVYTGEGSRGSVHAGSRHGRACMGTHPFVN